MTDARPEPEAEFQPGDTVDAQDEPEPAMPTDSGADRRTDAERDAAGFGGE